MKTFLMMGPSGPMKTTAPSIAKAWSNIRYRLVHECGLSWYEASNFDHSDLKEIQ